jgi:hypothetical protein
MHTLNFNNYENELHMLISIIKSVHFNAILLIPRGRAFARPVYAPGFRMALLLGRNTGRFITGTFTSFSLMQVSHGTECY